jgi:hypothetical protein
MTMSFNPVAMVCHGCETNHAGNMWKNKGEEKDLTVEAFLLTDQAYPPAFPASAVGGCMKVIRREDASLMDLANEMIALTRGKELHVQSIILIHSLTHMARSGTEGYIEDLLIATSKLRSVLGQQLTVAPLPHLFTAGCTFF